MTVQENFTKYASQAMAGLQAGAFLTTFSAGKTNTMTISWGSMGIIWGKPVFTVLIRESRYTKELIDKNAEFTVSIPLTKMQEALTLCGTKSGRAMDKITAAGLTVKPANQVSVPIISDCQLHYECKVLYKQEMNPEQLDAAVKEKAYQNGDYHTLYYGEILDCYLVE